MSWPELKERCHTPNREVLQPAEGARADPEDSPGRDFEQTKEGRFPKSV